MSRKVLLALCAASLMLGLVAAQAEEPFYKGKQLTLLINFAPGGPTDIEGRLLAKHIVKHIDGHPTVIVENKDGAAGMVGAGYLGELGPKDGTMFGYFTGVSWNFIIDPEKFRVDFRNYEFIGYQPGNAVYYIRSDIPPGMKKPADLMKAQGLIMGGLGRDSSKDLLQRLTFDMLGLKYRYVTGYRSSNTARLALENGEINMHSESTPGFLGVVEPNLVKSGKVVPIWYDPDYDGKSFTPGSNDGADRDHDLSGVLQDGQRRRTLRPVVGGVQDEPWGGCADAAHRCDAARFAARRRGRPAQGTGGAQRRQGLCGRCHDGDPVRAALHDRSESRAGGSGAADHPAAYARVYSFLYEEGR